MLKLLIISYIKFNTNMAVYIVYKYLSKLFDDNKNKNENSSQNILKKMDNK